MARECLVARLRMLNRGVTGFYDDALRPLGVKVSQTNVLTAIAKVQPVSPSALAEMLQIEKSTLSRNLDRMRRRGWVRINPGPSGNTRVVELRPKGRVIITQARKHWRSAQADAGTSACHSAMVVRISSV